MSIYSNVTEQDLINLRKLAEQQKEQKALKIKNRILKQTHDKKLAESLSHITEPITERLDKVNEFTQELGEIIKKSKPETPQPAIENTPQPATKNNQDDTQPQQPIENNEGEVYHVELENTLNKMKDNTGFFKTLYDPQRGWMMNNYPIKMSKGTNVKINENKYNITQGLRNVFTETKYDTAKSMTDTQKLVFRDISKKQVIIIINLEKERCQAVIDISNTNLIMMSVEFWI